MSGTPKKRSDRKPVPQRRNGNAGKLADGREWAIVEDEVIFNLRIGLTLGESCTEASVSMKAFQHRRARDPKLKARCKAAEPALKKRLLQRIINDKSWQSAIVLLKSKWPEQFSENRVIPHTPAVIRFEGNPDAGLPQVHPMAAAKAPPDADGEPE